MREIIFRGKDKLGHWLYGGFHLWETRQPCVCDDELKPEEIKHIIIKNSFADWNMPRTMQPYEVIPETVGQYTGLADKNGTKVFEGDILKFTDKCSNYEWIGKVEFGNPNAEYNWGFQLVYISGAKPNTDILLWFEMEETGAFSEVIGNIHDNPELLKECEG